MSKLTRIKNFVMDNVYDVETLVQLLELTIEDVLDRHPDALLDNAHKFGDFDVEQEDEVEYDQEEDTDESYLAPWDRE